MGANSLLLKIKAKDEASGQIDQVQGSLGGLGKTIVKTGLAFKAFDIVKDAVVDFANFEQAISDVAAVSGASEKDLNRFKTTAEELGISTEFTANQVAGAEKLMVQAGFDIQETIDGVAGVLNAASASGVDLATATDIVVSSIRGFNLEASETAKVSDILALTTNKTNTNMIGLGEAMKFVAPIASGVGQSISETAAMIGILGDSGIKGSLAGTALRKALVSLQDPSEGLKTTMADLGIELDDATGRSRPLSDIIAEMGEKGATTRQIFQAFGPIAGNAIQILQQKGAPALRALTKELENSTGAAEKMRAVRLDNILGEITLLESQLSGLSKKFVEAFGIDDLVRGSIDAIRTAITFWLDKFDDVDIAILDLQILMLELGKEASQALLSPIDALERLNAKVFDFAKFTIGQAIKSLGDFAAKVKAIPIIGNVIPDSALKALQEYGDELERDALVNKELMVASDLVTNALNIQIEEVKKTKEIFEQLSATKAKLAKQDKEAAEEASKAGAGAAGTSTPVARAAKESLDAVDEKLDLTAEKVVGLIESASSSIGGLVSSVGVMVGGTAGVIVAAAGQVVDIIAEGTEESWQNGIDAYIESAEKLGENLGPFFEVLVTNIDEILAGIVTGLFKGIVSLIQSTPQLIVDFFSGEFWDGWWDAASDAIDSFVNDIGPSLWEWITDALSSLFSLDGLGDIASNIGGGISDFFGFAEGGEFQVAGAGGTDSELVAFRATPGERVSVQTPEQQQVQSASTSGPMIVEKIILPGVRDTTEFMLEMADIMDTLQKDGFAKINVKTGETS